MRAALFFCLVFAGFAHAQESEVGGTDSPGAVEATFGRSLDKFAVRLTPKSDGSGSFSTIRTGDDWTRQRPMRHEQLRTMLGLFPWPQRTPLEATITKTQTAHGFTVENVHFQSRPGLYVTGNLYRPADWKPEDGKLPTVLYVCGHGKVKKNGISYGNKTHYRHHGQWFARNGYVCLVIDTIQLGEIEGIHHGTHRLGMWWWTTRGYTPAGVEAWNGMRAIDYLVTRDDVDPERIGVTGRSGGGAYSWYIAALDDRVKVAVPVAGITNMQNHIADGCIEGHCDCMYFVNSYGWSFAELAAMVAPRPLLIANTDNDPIFPLDGVVDIYTRTRRVYELLGQPKNIGLTIVPGPHADTQQLRVPAFAWLNHHLKGDDSPITTVAEKFLEPEDLKVFPPGMIPDDERVTTVQEWFVEGANPKLLSHNIFAGNMTLNLEILRDRSLRTTFDRHGWPWGKAKVHWETKGTIENFSHRVGTFNAGKDRPKLIVHALKKTQVDDSDEPAGAVRLRVFTHEEFVGVTEALTAWSGGKPPAANDPWGKLIAEDRKSLKADTHSVIYVGPDQEVVAGWDDPDAREITHWKRRYNLAGTTYDCRRIVGLVNLCEWLATNRQTVDLIGSGRAAGWVMYATALLSDQKPDIESVTLIDPPTDHREGSEVFHAASQFTVPQLTLMAASVTDRFTIIPGEDEAKVWAPLVEQARNYGWEENRLRIGE